MRYASFFNLAYPELELDNPLSRMHCIQYASSLYGKLRDEMTGRFNQDLPENLQMVFQKATNFEPQIITKQSINNTKVHEVNHINITHGEDEVEINEAHVRNPNYKGKNYDPNYQQNRTKMTNNMTTNTTSSHHNNGNQGYRYARSFCSHLGGVLCVYCRWFLLFLLQLCQRSLLLWLCINVLRLLGNVVRVYPRIIQGLTFLSA